MNLKQIIEKDDTSAGKIFDLFIQFLIILSLISFSIETLPNFSENTKKYLSICEIITVILFTVEYFLRLFVTDKRRNFIFSLYGIFDLLAILPFYIASGVDLRSIRLIRLFRILKIFRYNTALVRLKQAFISIKSELAVFAMISTFLLYIASIGIYYFENSAQPEEFSSIFHCLWWAVVTLTTVGYGDVYPITVGGRIFTSIIVIIGIGVVAIPTGLLASALTQVAKIDNPSNKKE